MTEMKLALPRFECSPSLMPHLRSVFEGEYEVPLWGSGKTIIDVGANVGAFSLWAAHRWPGSVIHAYEPNPDCLDILARNTKGFGVAIHPYGLGNPGERPLYSGQNNLGEASLYPNACTKDTGRHVEIKDPNSVGFAHILKLDCEGAELEILEVLLLKHQRIFEAIMFEVHSEPLRRACDSLMKDYRLVSSKTHCSGIGTYSYLRSDLCAF